MLEHKEIVFPEVDLSGDEGSPDWAGEEWAENPEHHYSTWVRPPGLYARVWEGKQEAWRETVTEYEANPASFYCSWHYLNDHPVYWRFHPSRHHPANHESCLETEYGFGSDAINVHVAQVCVKCRRIHEEDGPYEKATRIWLETGKWEMHFREGMKHHDHWHDIELDCGGGTYEEAVVKLARLVWEKYGNDRRIADAH